MPLLITIFCTLLSLHGTPPVGSPKPSTPPPTSTTTTTTATASTETRTRSAGWGERSWRDQHEDGVRFLRESRHPHGADLVLLGDSITQSFGGEGRRTGRPGQQALTRALPGLVIANQGISGDRTQHLLWRIEHDAFGSRTPPVVAIMIGTNNLPHDDPEAIARGIEAVVLAVEETLPETIVLLHAVPPRGTSPDDPMRTRVRATNQLIRRLAERDRVRWIDPWDALLEADGEGRRGHLAGDGVHLGGDGYRVWATALAVAMESVRRAREESTADSPRGSR